MERISRDDMFLAICKEVAKRGTCLRAQVGCLIVKDNRIISTGWNGSPPGKPHCFDVGCIIENGHCIRTIHAETNAIGFAARYGISTEGADLLTTGWPLCLTCEKLAISAGIRNIVRL